MLEKDIVVAIHRYLKYVSNDDTGRFNFELLNYLQQVLNSITLYRRSKTPPQPL